MEQFKNASLHREQLSLTTEQERKVEIFKMAFAFEEFARSYGQYHLNASIPQFIIANNKLGKWKNLNFNYSKLGERRNKIILQRFFSDKGKIQILISTILINLVCLL